MTDENKEKIELGPIMPKRYPEELEKLAKEIEEVKEGKRTDFSPEFKIAEETAPEKPGEAAKPEAEKPAEPEKPKSKKERKPRVKKNKEPKLEEVEKSLESTPASAEAPADKPMVEKPAEEAAKKEVVAEKKVEEPIPDDVTLVTDSSESPEPESGEPENPNFSTEEALNDREFLEFLTKYPDAEKIDPGSHKREIEKRHKVFQSSKVLGNLVGEFYNHEAGKELELPIGAEMNQRMLEAVEREAIASPESLIKRAQEITEYESLKENIAAFDKHLTEFGGASNREEAVKFIGEKLQKLGKEKHQKKISAGFLGFINPENNPIAGWWFQKMMTEEEKAWRKQIREAPKGKRKEIFAELDKKIEAFAKAKTELEKVNESGMRHRFDDLRQELFQKFEPTKMLFEDLQRRAATSLNNLLKKAIHGIPGIQKIEAAKEYLEKLRVLHKKFAFDIFDPQAFENQIDQRFEEIVESLVRENVKGFKITSKPLEKMLSEFSGMIGKESSERNKQSVFSAIVSAIDKTIDHLQASGRGKPAAENKESIAKKILLQAVKAKLLAELTK